MQNKIVFLFFAIMVIPLTILALTGIVVSDSVAMDTVDPEVTLNYPNGGEVLYIGNTADITWSATDFGLSANPVTISYSDNNGQDYTVLDILETNDGIYNWELPSTICYNNLIKIFAIDNFGNVGADSSDAVFSITYVPPAAPLNVNVDLSNEIDAVISWTEVDTTIFGNPITVDGYIVLYNETAYKDSMHCYDYLANTDNVTTTYTDLGVAESHEQRYYKVLAYKDYRGNIKSILANLSKGKLTWKEVQRRFK